MKNILSALFLFCSIALYSQNPIIQNFYNQYQDMENVSDVKLQGWLLKMAAEYTDEAEEQKMLNKISYLRVLIMSEGNLVRSQDVKSLIKDLKKDNFEELMKIQNGGAVVDIYLRESETEITDVLALINDNEDGFILLSIEGHIQFSDLNNLNIDVEGMDHLKEIPEDRKEVPRA